MPFEVGQEWFDGAGHWIIVGVEDRLTWDEDATVQYVTTFDWEGIIDTEPADQFQELIDELEMVPVVEPPLEHRVRDWRRHWPNFPL